LSWHWLFRIIRRKKRIAHDASQTSRQDVARLKNEERCGGE
jgi:hypothetical protein